MGCNTTEEGGSSMTNADTHSFIAYTPRNNVASTERTNDIPGLQGVPNGLAVIHGQSNTPFFVI
jgi:hypothetical protein